MKITKNYLSKIILTAFCFLIISYNQCGYASVTTEHISIQCSKTPNIVPIHKYYGLPDTQLSLVTEGIGVLGLSEIVTDWNTVIQTKDTHIKNDVIVTAECITYDNGYEMTDFVNIYKNMWPPGTVFTCNKGDGMNITMISPNDLNPEKYRYVATLIRDKDDEYDRKVPHINSSQETLLKHIPIPIVKDQGTYISSF